MYSLWISHTCTCVYGTLPSHCQHFFYPHLLQINKMPDKVAGRRRHSINVVGVCDNFVWVIVTGGLTGVGYSVITLFELSEEHKVASWRLFVPKISFDNLSNKEILSTFRYMNTVYSKMLSEQHKRKLCTAYYLVYARILHKYTRLWLAFCNFRISLANLKPPHSFLHFLVCRSYYSGRHEYWGRDLLGSGSSFRHLKYCRIDHMYIGKREIVTDQDGNIAEIVS